MRRSKVTILVIIFFLAGILLDRTFLYYEMGEKNKVLLKEQESIKDEYKLLIKRFEMVEQELELRILEDSIAFEDSILIGDSTFTEH